MNLNQLRFVRAVADTGSFSRAADMCHASQPTLSNGISQFEEELGGKLFIRTTRKVTITPFGEALLPKIDAVLAAREELLQTAKAFSNPEVKLLRIGLSPLVDMSLLNGVLEPFQRGYPDIRVFFKECFLDDLEQRLMCDAIDVAIVPQRARDAHVQTQFFYREPLFYLPCQRDTSAPRQAAAIRLRELPDEPLILTGGGCGMNDAIADLFSTAQVDYDAYPGQALSYRVVEEWAALGIGAGILPRAKVSLNNDSAIPLLMEDDSPATFSYEWLWSADNKVKDHVLKFRKFLLSTVPALVEGQLVRRA